MDKSKTKRKKEQRGQKNNWLSPPEIYEHRKKIGRRRRRARGGGGKEREEREGEEEKERTRETVMEIERRKREPERLSYHGEREEKERTRKTGIEKERKETFVFSIPILSPTRLLRFFLSGVSCVLFSPNSNHKPPLLQKVFSRPNRRSCFATITTIVASLD